VILSSAASRGPRNCRGQDQELKCGMSQGLGGEMGSSERAKDQELRRGSSLMVKAKMVSGRETGDVRMARWMEWSMAPTRWGLLDGFRSI